MYRPAQATGPRFSMPDCGFICYQRVFRDGGLCQQIFIYRDAEHGPCEVCMSQGEGWRGRAIDEALVYSSKLRIGVLLGDCCFELNIGQVSFIFISPSSVS